MTKFILFLLKMNVNKTGMRYIYYVRYLYFSKDLKDKNLIEGPPWS